LSATRVYSSADAGGKPSSYARRYELKRSGPLRALKVVTRDREEVYLAHPEHSFRAERKAAGDAWEISEGPRLSDQQSYQRIVRKIDETEPVTGASAPMLELADFTTNLVNPLCLRVAALERFSENGRRFIRLEFEDCPPGHPIYRKVSLELAGDDYSPVRAESLGKTGTTQRTHWVAVHDPHDGVPVFESARSEGSDEDGRPANTVLTVTDRRFGPIPEDEFTPERLLDGAPVHHIAAKPMPSEVPSFLSWYPLPLVLGLVSLAAGASLFLWSRSFRWDEPLARACSTFHRPAARPPSRS
jgi:hypothetical protein